ncbi:hypothetical protein [Kistimonas scapharcae]|uniref:hypothetical protein n=1 Tax=Kistimonas scapharcae TaxID=1036133 RepID=UPI0031EB2E5A
MHIIPCSAYKEHSRLEQEAERDQLVVRDRFAGGIFGLLEKVRCFLARKDDED